MSRDGDGRAAQDGRPEAETIPGLLLYRFDAPLFFANAELFRREVLELVARGTGDEPVQWVVIAAGSVTEIDATADQALRELHEELTGDGRVLAFAELRGVVRDTLHRSGTVELIGRDRFYPTVGRAVRAFVEETDSDWVDDEDGPTTDSPDADRES